jgi:hypothetical protein
MSLSGLKSVNEFILRVFYPGEFESLKNGVRPPAELRKYHEISFRYLAHLQV